VPSGRAVSGSRRQAYRQAWDPEAVLPAWRPCYDRHMCLNRVEPTLVLHRFEMAADPEAAAEAQAAGRGHVRRLDLVPRFHVLLTTFELASKVCLPRVLEIVNPAT